MTDHRSTPPIGADLYGELQLAEPEARKSLLRFAPGLVVVAIAALAALWLSEQYGVPVILLGLLIGLALNFVNADKRLAPGLDFSSQTLLRIGIVLLGTQITIAQISDLGLGYFGALIVIMGAVMLSGMLAARLLKQDVMHGLLAGGATAICGVSAALALWSIIGERRVDQSRFTLVLLGITLASAFAMTFYPLIASSLELSDKQAGFLIGASIHDVAQAIGGGYSYSNDAGEVAAIVKLSRVAMLAPILILVGVILNIVQQKREGGADTRLKLRQVLPWFLIGFFVLVLVSSTVALPAELVEVCDKLVRGSLLFAVIAAAIKSDMRGLLSHRWVSFGPVVVTTLVSFALSLLFAMQF